MFEKSKSILFGFLKFVFGVVFFAFIFAYISVALESLYNRLTGKEESDEDKDVMIEAVNEYYRKYGKRCPSCKYYISIDDDECPVCNNTDFSLDYKRNKYSEIEYIPPRGY